jgi:hypothetical protein
MYMPAFASAGDFEARISHATMLDANTGALDVATKARPNVRKGSPAVHPVSCGNRQQWVDTDTASHVVCNPSVVSGTEKQDIA